MSAESDRLAEAARWLDAKLAGAPIPRLILVLGLGEGYLLDVLESRAPETRVLALEPDARTAASFTARRDWRPWLESGRLIYLTGPAYADAHDAWRIFPPGSDAHLFLVNPALEENSGPDAVRAARVMKDILFGVRANADARRRFAPRYLVNAIRNLPALAAGIDVRALADVFKGVPAVVAGAGPSLTGNIGELRDAPGRAVLIATDTTLRAFLDAGLAPQFVVGLDPSESNARHFEQLHECPDTWLVGETALDRRATDPFRGRTFWFRVADHHPWPWYNELGIDVGRLEVWGSVLTAAFQVAVLAGCDPIVLAGADLAFTGGRPYCRGTTYEFDWSHLTANGARLDEAWAAQIARSRADHIHVPDLHGNETLTTKPLQSFRDWLIARAARSGRRVINATGAGIFFGEGVEQSTLARALPAPVTIPPLRGVARLAPAAAAAGALAKRVRDVAATVKRDARTGPPVAQWVEFSGEGYDPAAVGAALDEAARNLGAGTRRGAADDPAAIPWEALIRTGAARGMLAVLPEAIGRLHAGLSGIDPPSIVLPAEAEADGLRVTRVVQAFDLLDRIAAAARGGLAFPAFVESDPGGHIPVAGRWPGQQRVTWIAHVFEGLLGLAWTARMDPAEPSFFLSPVKRRHEEAPHEPSRSTPAPADAARFLAPLAGEWLTCVAALAKASDNPAASEGGARAEAGLAGTASPGGGPVEQGRLHYWLRALGEALRRESIDGRHAGPVLIVDASAEDQARRIEIPWPVPEPALARLMTGVISELVDPGTRDSGLGARPRKTSSKGKRAQAGGARQPLLLGEVTASGLTVRLDMAFGRTGQATHRPRREERVFLRPRVLTDEGMPRSVIACTTALGAVCTGVGEHNSVLVLEDGSTRVHSSWPEPLVGEIPFGAEGAVAWSGAQDWHDPTPRSVMYRSSADAPVTVDAVPFRPFAGTWWRGRLYWACFPSGLGTWAPGETPELLLPGLTLFAVLPDDACLRLEPCVRNDAGQLERRLLTSGWTWSPGGEPEPIGLGEHGAASCRAAGPGWTAVAHPEADVVRLESAGGRVVFLTCYYPFSVAWAGRSLIVTTVDGDLLLFERLVDEVERA